MSVKTIEIINSHGRKVTIGIPSENTNVISIRETYLSKIPINIIDYSCLASLNLSRNNFTMFPEEIISVTSLKELEFSYNSLKSLPYLIYKLAELEYLDVSNNNIETLPSSLARLNKLKTLNIMCNRIRAFPSNFSKVIDTIVDFKPRHNPFMHTYNDFIRLPYDDNEYFKKNIKHMLKISLEKEKQLLIELALSLAPLDLPVLLVLTIFKKVYQRYIKEEEGWHLPSTIRWNICKFIKRVHNNETEFFDLIFERKRGMDMLYQDYQKKIAQLCLK